VLKLDPLGNRRFVPEIATEPSHSRKAKSGLSGNAKARRLNLGTESTRHG
jgi:hypothetical protein